jgi:hypothetical protein
LLAPLTNHCSTPHSRQYFLINQQTLLDHHNVVLSSGIHSHTRQRGFRGQRTQAAIYRTERRSAASGIRLPGRSLHPAIHHPRGKPNRQQSARVPGLPPTVSRSPNITHTHDLADKPSFANPSPLGLLAFGATTFILSLFNVRTRGITHPNVVLGMALFYGGLVQLIAGIEVSECNLPTI